jgi:hypothetical protein
MYASLRVGPWSIERRDRLDRLRDIARRETDESERRLEFAMRQWERRRPGEPIPLDESGNIVMPFEIDRGAIEALDAPGTPPDPLEHASSPDGIAPYDQRFPNGSEHGAFHPYGDEADEAADTDADDVGNRTDQ